MRSRDAWVVDASVVTKWSLRDEDMLKHADGFRDGFRDGSLAVVAPHLSRHEVASSLAVACKSGRITPDTAQQESAAYISCGLSMETDPGWLIDEALRLTLDLPVAYYDAVYLALAMKCGMEFVTADRKLLNAVGDRLNCIHWLGDVSLA